MTNNEPVPVTEVAAALGVGVRTVHRMIHRGELPAQKAHDGLRAPYLVPRAAFEELLAQHRARLADLLERAS